MLWKIMAHIEQIVEQDDTTTLHINTKYCCRRCKISFEFKRDLLLHNKQMHNTDVVSSKFVCEICNKGFVNLGNMYRHMKGHGDIRPHVCSVCGKAFAQAVNLQRHQSVHTGERPFVCQLCKKSFTQPGNLRRHELLHTGEKPFRCKRCGRMFSQRVNLKKHVMMHQGYRPFSCEICNKSFLQSQNFKKHMMLKHTETEIKVEQEDLCYLCAICSTVFDKFADFQSHEIFCEVAGEEQIETSVHEVNQENIES